MKRRHLLLAIGALPFAVRAQSKTWVVGLLDAGERLEWWAAFRAQLRQLGYAEGRNVVIKYRWGHGRNERLPSLIAELVHR